MKLLIVDDEPSVREMTRLSINCARAGVSEIYEAGSGPEALEILRALRPEAALIDMNMPGMDGAELMRRIDEAGLNVRLVVISGYDDFAYAKQALLHGAVNYILKPINASELNQTLSSIAAELESRAAPERRRAPLPFLEAPDRHVLDECARLCAISPGGSVLAVQAYINDEREAARRCGGDGELLALEVVAQLSEAAGGRGAVVKNLSGGPGIYALLPLDDAGAARAQALAFCQSAEALLRPRGLHCAFGVALEGGPCAPQGCARAFWEGNLLGAPAFFEADARAVPVGVELQALGLREGVLCAARMRDGEAAVHAWERALTALRGEEFLNLSFFYSLAEPLLQGLGAARGEALQGAFSALDFEAIAARLARRVGDLQSSGAARRPGDELTARAVGYILAHYAEPITLDVLARALFASREHICKQFKKSLGVNLSAYLRNVRLERAFMLIQRTARPIADIAQEVGFADSSYFIKSFRQRYGCAPLALRK